MKTTDNGRLLILSNQAVKLPKTNMSTAKTVVVHTSYKCFSLLKNVGQHDIKEVLVSPFVRRRERTNLEGARWRQRFKRF
jgi:hypothetical protein